MRKPFHIGENAGAGGGKAGNHFKQGVQIRGDIAGQIKRQRPRQTQHDPAAGNGGQSLAGIENMLARLKQTKHKAGGQAQKSAEKEELSLRLSVNQGNEARQRHQGGFDFQKNAQRIHNQCNIHELPPDHFRRMSLMSVRPGTPLTRTTVSPTKILSLPRGIMILP